MFDVEPPDDGPPRRGRREPPPDPRVQLTFLFLSSLLIAQLASSVLTSQNLYRLFETEVLEPNRRLENRIRKEDATPGGVPEEGAESTSGTQGRGSEEGSSRY